MIIVTLRRREAAAGIETNDAQPDARFILDRGRKAPSFKRPAPLATPNSITVTRWLPKYFATSAGSQHAVEIVRTADQTASFARENRHGDLSRTPPPPVAHIFRFALERT